MANTQRIILFDGICNLCNGFVAFVVQRDRMKRFKFLSLQSPKAIPILAEHGIQPQVTTIVLIDHGRAYTQSTAVLRILKGLNKCWPIFYVLICVPKPLRDFIYKYVARNRYRWFGQRDTCLIPDGNWQEHFY